MKRSMIPLCLVIGASIALFVPELAYGTVQSTLQNIQNTLLNTLLPAAVILGFIFTGISFVMGSSNARTYLTLSIIGAIIGFLAPHLMEFLRSLVV